MNPPSRSGKTLVLGMDGLDPRRVSEMAQSGSLPAFARLQQLGTLRALSTSNPAESPVAWSALATGCDSGRHGIFDFLHRHPTGYVPYLSICKERKRKSTDGGTGRYVTPRQVPGFWRYASDAGIPTTVVRWPVTFPAEQVTGNFLAGLGVPDVNGRMGKHTIYTTGEVDDTDEKVVRVGWRHGRIHTHLLGPEMSSLRGVRPTRVRLDIEPCDGGVTLSADSQRIHARVGEWSDWLSVRFRWGPVAICEAIVKFRLVSLEPELRLFATPLQIDPEQQSWPLTEPESYGAELADRLGKFYTLGLGEDTHAVTDGRYDLDGFLQQCGEIDRERRGMFEHELNRFSDGLLAFVFDAGDRVQHMCWSIADVHSSMYDPARAKRYGHVIDDLYREMDDVLATALDAVGDDATVFVVSDHGFGSFNRAVNLNRWLIENGYMTLRGQGEGRNLFADVDWKKTQAYAVGFTSIYLNLDGRESKGIVAPGEQADDLRRELGDRLCQLSDTNGGASAIRSVYDAREIYNGPLASDGPDLVVGFAPGYRASWQTALGGAPSGVLVDNDSLWAADHLMDPSTVPGVLACNVCVVGGEASGLDLAPTVLDSLGLPVPSHMQGRSWLTDGGERTVPQNCAPDEVAEPVGAGVADSASDGLDEEQRRRLEQHLGDLGYL